MDLNKFRDWNGSVVSIPQLQKMVDRVEDYLAKLDPKEGDGYVTASSMMGDTLVYGEKDYGGSEISICKVTNFWASYDKK